MKRSLAAAVVLATAALALAPSAEADRIHMKDGRVIEGKVVKDERGKVHIERKYGIQVVDKADILKIEKVLTPKEEFDQGFAAAKSVKDFIAVGKKAREGGLEDEARRAFERAIELEKDNQEAREALGHKFHEGRWWTDEEWSKRPEVAEERKRAAEEAARRRADESQAQYGRELAGVGWGDAHIITTKNYIVKCNSTKEVAQKYADFLEKINAAYQKVFAKYKKYWDKPSIVYIFRNNTEFQEYMQVGEGVGGFYVPKTPNENAYPSRVVAAFHGSFGTSGDTRLVLAHECTHQLEHVVSAGKEETFMVRPAWWVEGLAVYFGDGFSFDRKGNLKIGIPRDRLSVLQRLIKDDIIPKQLKLSQFVRLSYAQFSVNAGATYPYAWSLVHYFLHRGEDKKGVQRPVKINGKDVELAKVFDKFFQVVTENPPKGEHTEPEYYADKLDKLLGFSIDELTEDWKKYVMDLELPKLGKVKGKVYESIDTGFTVEKPGGDWAWKEDEVEGDEAIRMVSEAGAALVRIAVDGNMFNWTLEDAANEFYGRLPATPEQTNEILVNGFPATEFIYHATPESGPRSGTEQYYRHVVVTTLKRIYQIVAQCDADKAEANKEAFEKVLAGFNILKDKEN